MLRAKHYFITSKIHPYTVLILRILNATHHYTTMKVAETTRVLSSLTLFLGNPIILVKRDRNCF